MNDLEWTALVLLGVGYIFRLAALIDGLVEHVVEKKQAARVGRAWAKHWRHVEVAPCAVPEGKGTEVS